MHHLAVLLLLIATEAPAQHRMYVADIASKAWVAGVPMRDGGLHARDFGLGWERRGFLHPDIQAIAFDPRDPKRIFLAGGSGLILAEDRGRRWRILTSNDMAEARDVAIDPHEPASIYLALPDGLGLSRDGGATWTRTAEPTPRHYTHTVAVDRTRAGRILRGGETGLWLSENRGATWKHAGPNALETTDLVQSPHDPSFWLASTQHAGLWASHDNGISWTRIEPVDGASTLYNAAFNPTHPGRIATCGWGAGVQVSSDSGKTWAARSAGLPTSQCWRVAWDPDFPGRLYAAIHEEAIHVSDDAGLHWSKAGLDGSIVYDIAFVRDPSPATFAERKQEVLERHAAPGAKGSLTSIAANLYLKRPCEGCSEKVIDLVREPTGDMFWMFPITAVSYLDHGQLSDAARAAIRRAWKTYMPYRGDTENHWLLYYTPLYLMSQKYKNESASEWFNGNSSQENFIESRDWINHWMTLTLDRGQGEYDCTHYLDMFIVPLSYLSAWSEDPVMRKRAAMMLEYIQADFASETLEGIYVGAHARTDDRQVREKWAGSSSDMAWLFFNKGFPLPGFSGYTTFYLVGAGTDPPAVIRAMAERRSSCTLQTEKKRTRNRWRFNDQRNGDVYKTTYICPDYAVSSDQGGILQPIQQHSWDVTWHLSDPRGKHNTLFALHPYSSMYELQTYFTFMPDFGTENVVRSKKTYDSPDKFLGGSPFEQIAQDRDAIVSLYRIPAATRFEHINAFFSKDLDATEEDVSPDGPAGATKSGENSFPDARQPRTERAVRRDDSRAGGWIFARAASTYIAFRPLAPYNWQPLDDGGRRLVSPHLNNGVVMQIAAANEFANWDEFKSKVRALKLETSLTPNPKVTFTTLRGRTLQCEYGKTPTVDGVPIDYSKWKPFDGPFIRQERGSRKVEFTAGGLHRTLDFDTLTVK